MSIEMLSFWIAVGVIAYLYLSHYVSYSLLKNKILKDKQWGLNVCCGKTDGGGVNADIFEHKELPNFRLLDDIYNLPFLNQEFETILCSHTIEHVDDPAAFLKELRRVGKEVTIVIPPLYDITAALNLFEHKWIFLTFKKKHTTLPPHIRLPFSNLTHNKIGQINNA